MVSTVHGKGFTLASLYCGAGGLDIGFVAAGYIPLYSIDIDQSAIETYSASLKRLADRLPHLGGRGHLCVCGDLDRHLSDLRDVEVDVVIGGPPCQGFSVAGKMDLGDPRSRHVWRFLDAVEAARPRGFVMENVKALAANRRWSRLLDGLRDKAAELGYETHVLLLNASRYGVPQARERMFLIGVPPGSSFEAPTPTSAERPPAVRDALDALPPWRSPGNDSVCTARVTPARRPVMRRSPFAGMLFNGAGRPMRLDRPAPTLLASMGGNCTPIVDQVCLDGLDDCWVTRYHAHLAAGGAPCSRIPPRLRRITVEEAAAIQGFPVDMEWRGAQSAIYRQIGNAVPPALGTAVAEALGTALAAT
ncbi:DNA cytosine methyltransferase [Candidatus Poriferisodalis sp.]|uniref:DNA cytosine methyltransferase n=1 Tax=Candidatus Poriferisodalis sp. TaxID=3101277 RepID=UPI003C6F9F8D